MLIRPWAQQMLCTEIAAEGLHVGLCMTEAIHSTYVGMSCRFASSRPGLIRARSNNLLQINVMGGLRERRLGKGMAGACEVPQSLHPFSANYASPWPSFSLIRASLAVYKKNRKNCSWQFPRIAATGCSSESSIDIVLPIPYLPTLQ